MPELCGRDSETVARVDVSFKPLTAPQMMTQRETAMSLIGRVVDDDLLDDCPELGGFEVETLGPCSVAMDKLLAQTQTSDSGDLVHRRRLPLLACGLPDARG